MDERERDKRVRDRGGGVIEEYVTSELPQFAIVCERALYNLALLNSTKAQPQAFFL